MRSSRGNSLREDFGRSFQESRDGRLTSENNTPGEPGRYTTPMGTTYGYDLLAFCRWLLVTGQSLSEVGTEVLLRFLWACREAKIPGRAGPNVIRLTGRRLDQCAATTINRRLAAISGLFAFAAMRDPEMKNPVPKGREARWRAAGERSGMLAHTVRRPKNRSSLRLREPRRLPTALSQPDAAELLASFRTWRDRAIAGLMPYCGLRSAEVLALDVAVVDIGGRWLRVIGKGQRERRVPLDADVASVMQVYLLAERPESGGGRLFLLAKGPNRGQPLTAAGLRTVFLARPRHVDTTARYLHLAPAHVKAEFDAARDRIRSRQ